MVLASTRSPARGPQTATARLCAVPVWQSLAYDCCASAWEKGAAVFRNVEAGPVIEPVPSPPDAIPRGPRVPTGLLALGIALWALLMAAWVSTAVFDRLPHVEDEVAFLFQARTFAAGHVVAPAPPEPSSFSIPFVIVRDGMWFGKYPPGYPLVLALGVLIGQPW